MGAMDVKPVSPLPQARARRAPLNDQAFGKPSHASVWQQLHRSKAGALLAPAKELQRQAEADNQPACQHSYLRSHLGQACSLQHIHPQSVDDRR